MHIDTHNAHDDGRSDDMIYYTEGERLAYIYT